MVSGTHRGLERYTPTPILKIRGDFYTKLRPREEQ